ncbi:glycoside hydrolase 43 family protein [Sporanaerobium hydrogeniformans]|uniref:Glycoside hydrolase 43 family protein n=1 Tax=Sporanaerobium hydrogeniformans TaxID=3072179 RepID=A0AC61DCZ4_9FIRM|nr:glycoside hydrolase family 43 protein [Sporanaerobium hydrogeniformans]PHV70447.1 glycoside hydrolase 43 family protein [Sporanaerobium hydrogeniformans]
MKVGIQNPILRGFNPDPSILRVGEDYYIATSTFEWFPGVQIHHSKDLVSWELVARPLCTIEHLNMIGNLPSAGVWAPCLSYDNGLFYLIFSDVKAYAVEPFKDVYNYVTTATQVGGEWSKPSYLNSSGFDPSLFHDEDGRKWLVNMEWDYRKQGIKKFTGILLQEYDAEQKKLVGESYKIFAGTSLGLTEAPHLYKRNGYYYLVTAEGGTSYEHAVTVARSRTLLGPYTVHPRNPILTAYGKETLIQKAGHASLVETPEGKWYIAYLGARPIQGKCPLGRETCLQELEWDKEDWPFLKGGGNSPRTTVEVEVKRNESLQLATREQGTKHYLFNEESFWEDFQSLRVPLNKEDIHIDREKGYLSLRGRESIYSRHYQSLLARRQEDLTFEAEVVMQFEPSHFMQMAGLIYRYNEENLYYLYMSHDEHLKSRVLCLICVNQGTYTLLATKAIQADEVTLKVKVEKEKTHFYYKEKDQESYQLVADNLDTTILSDEHAIPMCFTGAFVGLCVQDLKEQKCWATFKRFTYTGKE